MRSSRPACGLLLALPFVAAVESRADPEPLRDDLSVRWVMYLSNKMVRIERDPTDGRLYSLRLDGTIFRIDPESATATVAYTAADHGLGPRSPGLDGACGTANCDHTLGLAIGPDGTFYITGNRHGERTVRLPRAFAGRRDGDGNRRWEEVRDLEVADIPLEEMREAARMRLRSATDPDLSLLLLNQESDIVRFDGELIVAAEEHGVPSPDALFIDGEGTWYLIVSDEEELRRHNIASIVRGRMEGGERVWSLVAETDPYPFSGSGFDHLVNAVAVGPDNRVLYVNSGSRTDHGEVKENQGGVSGPARDAVDGSCSADSDRRRQPATAGRPGRAVGWGLPVRRRTAEHLRPGLRGQRRPVRRRERSVPGRLGRAQLAARGTSLRVFRGAWGPPTILRCYPATPRPTTPCCRSPTATTGSTRGFRHRLPAWCSPEAWPTSGPMGTIAGERTESPKT